MATLWAAFEQRTTSTQITPSRCPMKCTTAVILKSLGSYHSGEGGFRAPTFGEMTIFPPRRLEPEGPRNAPVVKGLSDLTVLETHKLRFLLVSPRSGGL